jgi:cell division protein FtsL
MPTPAASLWAELLGTQMIQPRRALVRNQRALSFRIVVGIILIGASAMVYVWIHLQNISMGYALAQIHRRHEDLLQRRSELQIEWEMLRAPQRIARVAEEELGMIPPDPQEMVIVK